MPAGLLPRSCRPGHPLGELAAARGRARVGADHRSRSPRSARTTPPPPSSAVPARHTGFAYISCGTWGLVGVELDRAGAHRGQPGRELHQRGRRRRPSPLPAQRHGPVAAVGVAAHLGTARVGRRPAATARRGRGAARRRPAHRRRRPAVPAARGHAGPDRRACRDERAPPVPADPAGVVRCILDSLAVAFARAVERRRAPVRAAPIDVVHIVGGGSQNALLCQLTADAAGLPVLAGPVEATALGNVLVQARAHGAITGDLAALRGRVRAATRLRRYEPRGSARRA